MEIRGLDKNFNEKTWRNVGRNGDLPSLAREGNLGERSIGANGKADKKLDKIDCAEMNRRERELLDRPRFQEDDEL